MKQAAEVLSALAAALTNPISEVLKMAKRILPTPEQLRELLRYDSDTGKLYWKERPINMFSSLRYANSWNSRYAKKEAFTVSHSTGYKMGSVFDKAMKAHRVAWAIFYGAWPDKDIDHKNSDGYDNRISNLRLASVSENNQNIGRRANNTSGYKGVQWSNQKGKWQAQIKSSGVRVYLGFFDNPEDAYRAYCKAAADIHGEFANFG